MDVKNFLDKKNTIAVVGASTNPEKWGYKIYMTLKKVFPRVYAVNPRHERIGRDECYPDLESLPEKPDVVITVVPPKITENVVKTCRDLGIKRVWMQPGSESKKAMDFCKDNGMEFISNLCFVMNGLKIRWETDG